MVEVGHVASLALPAQLGAATIQWHPAGMSRWTPADLPDLSGRTALVTGANSGLGFHTSLELARHGARVLMGCRDPRRAQDALVRLQSSGPTAELLALDLASLSSIEAAATEVASRVPSLDVLVCNAGVMAPPKGLTADGFETQLGTNHLGHFALTGRLLPQLLAGSSPRVVVVSSGAHRMGRIAFDDLQGERSYRPWSAYGQSKLANLLFAGELDRRAAGRLAVMAAHPGYAATHLQTGQGSVLMEALMRLGNATLAQSDAQGAWPSLFAAGSPDARSGDYYGPSLFELRGHPQRVGRSAAARDAAVAGRLWDVSEQLTGVRYDALT